MKVKSIMRNKRSENITNLDLAKKNVREGRKKRVLQQVLLCVQNNTLFGYFDDQEGAVVIFVTLICYVIVILLSAGSWIMII